MKKTVSFDLTLSEAIELHFAIKDKIEAKTSILKTITESEKYPCFVESFERDITFLSSLLDVIASSFGYDAEKYK